MRPWLARLGLLLALGAATGRPAAADDLPTRLPLAEATIPDQQVGWYAVSLLGARVAWTRLAIERLPGADAAGPALVRVTQESHVGLTMAGTPHASVETRILEFDGTPPYALRGALISIDADGAASSARVDRTPTGYRSVRTARSGTTETDLGRLDFTLADQLAMRTWVAGGRHRGDVLVYRTFDTAKLTVAPTRAEVLDTGSIDTPGGSAPWVDVRLLDATDGTTTTIRYDVRSGRSLYMTQGPYAMHLTSEAAAKSGAPVHDLLDVLSIAKVDAPLGEAKDVAGLVLEVDGEGAGHLRDAPGQSVIRDPTVRRVVLTLGEGAAPLPPATPAQIEEALAPLDRYGAALPEVATLAAQATAGLTAPRDRVQALVAFVSKHVRYDLQPGDLPLDHLLRARRGDCSEVAILFTALARANGIPTREVDGLVYLGDKAQAFGGHRWNEVVLDGRWIAVDPTYGQVPADVPRIALARGVPAAATLTMRGPLAFHVRTRRPAR